MRSDAEPNVHRLSPAHDPTGGVHATTPATPAPTGGELLNRASRLRDDAHALHDDATGTWLDLRLADLDQRATVAQMRAPHDLLRELARERGLAWALIARLAGVSATAVRKWRRGEAVAPENRRSLARIVALMNTVAELRSPLEEPATWLETPISDHAVITPADLFVARRLDLLLQLATGRVGAHAVLDAFDSEWRSRHARDHAFTVVRAADGELGIAERDRDG